MCVLRGRKLSPSCHLPLNKTSGTLVLLVSLRRMGHWSRFWALQQEHQFMLGQFWGYTTPQPPQPGWWQSVIVYPKHTANFAVFNHNRQHPIYLNLQLNAEEGFPLVILEPNPIICFFKWVLSATSLQRDHKTSGMRRIFASKLIFNSTKKKPNLSSHSKALVLTPDPNYAPSGS